MTTWVAMRKYTGRPKTQYFQTTKIRKTHKILIIRQNDWCDLVQSLRCDAFAIARFLVVVLLMYHSQCVGFSAHVTLLERTLAVDIPLSVRLSVKRVHPDKMK